MTMERGIAVFGSSEPRPGEPLYEQALELGRLLGQAGHVVVTGAYGGIMEAASRGALEAGGRTLGVACDIFSDRRAPNGYLSSVLHTPDLHLRQRELIAHARGFVVMSGKAGTLSELSLLWALHRGGCLTGRPVVLLGGYYADLLIYLERNRILEAPQLEMCDVVDSPAAALEALTSRLEAIEESG